MPRITSRILFSALAAVALAGSAAVALAQDMAVTADPALSDLSVEEMIAKRQATMKENGGLLRSAGGLTGDEAVAAAGTIQQNFANLTVLFPEGSVSDDSEALPAIWEDWATFEGYLMQGVEAAGEMKVAAEAGDAAAYGAAMKTIGGLCGQCHQQFREKD